ncbi:MAG: FliM/FliN family flagellar motor switch protein [Pseudooceanicola sp.]|nr:FliM/FliN family flagellar motor switch protein [Pseudooceanicola sp.]
MAETDTIEDRVVDQMIRSAKANYQRLPVLEVIVDRFTLALAPVMKAHCAGNTADAALASFTYSTVGEALESLPLDSLAMVAAAHPWEGDIGVVLDHELLFTTLEILLGGRAASRKDWTPRAYSAIERKFGARLCQAALNALAEAFARLCEVQFVIDHIESSPQAMVLSAPSGPCVKITMRIDFDGRGGNLMFLFPTTVFESIRSILSAPFHGGQLGGDSSWRDLLSGKLEHTPITIDAVLHEPVIALADILNWKPGVTVPLGITEDQHVTVSCDNLKFFSAAVGRRRNGAVALRVVRDYSEEEEPTDVTFD